MKIKKEGWLAGGYWLVFWILPALVFFCLPTKFEASTALSYFDHWALASLLIPLVYIVRLPVEVPAKLKKILFYLAIPALVMVTLLASQLHFDFGGF